MDLQLVSALDYDSGKHLSRRYVWERPGEWVTIDNETDRAWLLKACPVALRERVNLGYQHFRFTGKHPQPVTFYNASNAPFQKMMQPGTAYRFDTLNARNLGGCDRFEAVTAAQWLANNPAGRVLLVRSGGLGDLLFTTPALREIKRRFPECHLTAAVAAHHQRVLQNNPDVDVVTTRDRAYADAPHAFIADLEYYVETAPRQQEVGRVELFAGALGVGGLEDSALRYFTTAGERRRAAETLGEDSRPTVVVQPHGSCPARHCTAARMQQIIAGLRGRGWRIVTLGNYAPDGGWGSDLDLSGQTDLAQAAAIIEMADAYLGLDSGLTHLANALGKPVVALYGPIDGKLRVSGHARCTVLQGNAYANCEPCNDNRKPGCNQFPQCLEEIPTEAICVAVEDAVRAGKS